MPIIVKQETIQEIICKEESCASLGISVFRRHRLLKLWKCRESNLRSQA